MLDVLFPNAPAFSTKVESPATPRYNCVAWAVHCDALSIWPDQDNSWPVELPRVEDVDTFIKFFKLLSFEEMSVPDVCFETKYEKIAIYATGPMPTHVSRQHRDGSWKSKLGIMSDIWHRDPYVIQSKDYGMVVKIMRRPWDNKAPILPAMHPPAPLIFIP